MPTNLENSAVAVGLEMVSFRFNAKEHSSYHTTALIFYASKVILSFLQASLKQYVNQEVPIIKAGFRKGRRNRDDQHSLDHRESKRIPEKHLLH